ncbi:hypothetical protein FPV67DRAFT_1028270 [Lyophyllum atratum]|nr:hypothetical protein FPV67DRAFT_1028270 [Lyophyllum atratum]
MDQAVGRRGNENGRWPLIQKLRYGQAASAPAAERYYLTFLPFYCSAIFATCKKSRGTVDVDSGPNPLANEAGSDVDHSNMTIGQTLHFISGQYVLMELQKLQKTVAGRKYAKVDNTARQREEEIPDYREISRIIGIVCMMDLFPVPEWILSDTTLVSPSIKLSKLDDSQELQHYTGQFTFFPLYPCSVMSHMEG